MSSLSRVASVGLFGALVLVGAACGAERNFDNPPISPEVLQTIQPGSTSTTIPPSTAFVPSTAPTTVAPPTDAPPPATYAPTTPPPASETTQPAPQTTKPVPVTTVPPTAPGETYTVVQGDTLYRIATKLGVSLDALLAVNGFTSSSLIVPGQTLVVPAGGSAPEPEPKPEPEPEPEPEPNPNPPTTKAQGPPATTKAPPAATTQPQVPPPANGGLTPTQTAASCQADDSVASDNKTPVVFAPTNVTDGDPATAWRCNEGTADQSITFTFGAPTHVTSVGLINGYAKDDPNVSADRYLQNQRAKKVRWVFDDGTVVVQDLADDTRTMQRMAVDVTAGSVRLEIVEIYPAEGELPRNMTAISEVELLGD